MARTTWHRIEHLFSILYVRSEGDLTARARIRHAALKLFGAEGVNRVSVRAIAAEAGVSAGLVVHHFGSKDGLRKACDTHVVSMMRRPGGDSFDDISGLAAMLEAATPVRRYLARAFLDGSPEAAALFDEIVDHTAGWLVEGQRNGSVRQTGDPRARAALYVTWLLAPLAFDEHLSRVLGVEDLHGMDATLRYSRAALEMFTHGVFADDRALTAWEAIRKGRQAP